MLDPAYTTTWLAGGLHQIAAGLANADPDVIRDALADLRAAEASFAAFSAAIAAARENVAFAPARWRKRGALGQYVEGADHLTYALRNVRVMARRAITSLGDQEHVPAALPASIALLGDAVELLKHAWAKGVEPVATRERALRAAAESGRAYDEGVGFSGSVIVAQVRTAAADLLRATGVDYAEAPKLVRRAVGWHPRARTRRPDSGRPGPGTSGRGPS